MFDSEAPPDVDSECVRVASQCQISASDRYLSEGLQHSTAGDHVGFPKYTLLFIFTQVSRTCLRPHL